MSLLNQIVEKLRTMTNIPSGVPFNPVAALERIGQAFLSTHAAAQALQMDRKLLRQALCGYAWDYGSLIGRMGPEVDRYSEPRPDDVEEARKLICLGNLVIEWPPDKDELDEKPPEDKKLIDPGRGLVTLH